MGSLICQHSMRFWLFALLTGCLNCRIQKRYLNTINQSLELINGIFGLILQVDNDEHQECYGKDKIQWNWPIVKYKVQHLQYCPDLNPKVAKYFSMKNQQILHKYENRT